MVRCPPRKPTLLVALHLQVTVMRQCRDSTSKMVIHKPAAQTNKALERLALHPLGTRLRPLRKRREDVACRAASCQQMVSSQCRTAWCYPEHPQPVLFHVMAVQEQVFICWIWRLAAAISAHGLISAGPWLQGPSCLICLPVDKGRTNVPSFGTQRVLAAQDVHAYVEFGGAM